MRGKKEIQERIYNGKKCFLFSHIIHLYISIVKLIKINLDVTTFPIQVICYILESI